MIKNITPREQELEREVAALKAKVEALKNKPIVLNDIEQYRMQMAGISTASFGYWKEGDSIHPDYDTIALRDVAKLYAKYDELYQESNSAKEKTE